MLGSLWFNSFSAGGGGAAADYELISTTVLGSSAASVTFSGLGTYASTYKHLQIRAVTIRTGNEWALMQFNSDTTSGNYYFNHRLEGNGSSVASGAQSTVAGMVGASWSYQFGTVPNPHITDITDAFSTTKNKTIRTLSGAATGRIALDSSLWMSTAAITSIAFKTIDASNWAIGSRFSLYGLK